MPPTPTPTQGYGPEPIIAARLMGWWSHPPTPDERAQLRAMATNLRRVANQLSRAAASTGEDT